MTKTKYVCDICGKEYDSPAEEYTCKISHPISSVVAVETCFFDIVKLPQDADILTVRIGVRWQRHGLVWIKPLVYDHYVIIDIPDDVINRDYKYEWYEEDELCSKNVRPDNVLVIYKRRDAEVRHEI